jgi:hypothetical protein
MWLTICNHIEPVNSAWEGRERLVAVRPREDVALLFAVKLVQSGGPDRG